MSFDIPEDTQFYIYTAIFTALCFYFFVYRGKVRRGPLNSDSLIRLPDSGHPGYYDDYDDYNELLGVAPVQRERNISASIATSQDFPSSPIMPHLNIIEGIAPFNPDIDGKEWGVPAISGSTMPGRTATTGVSTDTLAKAIYVAAHQKTPPPEMIPIPTMFPSPLHPDKVSKPERFYSSKAEDEYNGYVNQPQMISLQTPLDAQMSKWTQYGPCNENGEQERTRTCIHGPLDNGKPCGSTLEKRQCQ